MKRRAEVDQEIESENQSIAQIERTLGRRTNTDRRFDREVAEEVRRERGAYRWSEAKARAKRDAGIMEKWEMGWPRQDIAAFYDITEQRVSQIVNGFGGGWR